MCGGRRLKRALRAPRKLKWSCCLSISLLLFLKGVCHSLLSFNFHHHYYHHYYHTAIIAIVAVVVIYCFDLYNIITNRGIIDKVIIKKKRVAVFVKDDKVFGFAFCQCMDLIRKIFGYGYIRCLLVTAGLASGDVIILPCSLFVPCRACGQRIACAWYFDKIGGLLYYLYILPKLILAMDLVIVHPVLHDTSRWIVAELDGNTIEPEKDGTNQEDD